MIDFDRDCTEDHCAYHGDVDYRIQASDGFVALVGACIVGCVGFSVIRGAVALWEVCFG